MSESVRIERPLVPPEDVQSGCPKCGHQWDAHDRVEGCLKDWMWDSNGRNTQEGCLCLLSHTRLSQ